MSDRDANAQIAFVLAIGLLPGVSKAAITSVDIRHILAMIIDRAAGAREGILAPACLSPA